MTTLFVKNKDYFLVTGRQKKVFCERSLPFVVLVVFDLNVFLIGEDVVAPTRVLCNEFREFITGFAFTL